MSIVNPGSSKLPSPPKDAALLFAFLSELVRALEARNVRVNAVINQLTGGYTGSFVADGQTVTVVNGIITSVV